MLSAHRCYRKAGPGFIAKELRTIMELAAHRGIPEEAEMEYVGLMWFGYNTMAIS